ncbi:enoyl-[acyl-carrier-protein] reductase FabV [Actinoplanes sp. TRM 88003]|uniref:trans-2-enoyl-CoA reductase (NAD(+)) n=1 Tax=Paractinoplanes aksuensis TaxID=2939490 RepID=A0ABT1DFT1_9ACTN|nr:enoyl-[acyl-carrier-protein] reductase FabV [Actinoplanes aksuensis]
MSPSGRGFLLIDAHPAGCFRTVADLREQLGETRTPERRRTALVIGSSAGYGLAATVAGLARYGIEGVGIAFERPPGRRTATAGWYRTIATAALSPSFTFLNADAFADTTKQQALDLIADRFGRLDHLIYSVAAPRRGPTYQSVIKPLGAEHTTRTLEFDRDGVAELREVTVTPATDDEAAATVKVMGGEDWSWWVAALQSRGLLHDGFTTVALSYIGSRLTSAIYRDGTIGAAKVDLENTAAALTKQLAAVGGRAFTSVNGAAVTQASTAIPGIALYVSLLRGVLGERMVSPLEQSVQLWDQLTGAAPLDLDPEGRIRLDRWELDPAVQAAVADRWSALTPANVDQLADIPWFRGQFRALYGFDIPGVDYTVPVETDQPWPA